MKQIAGTVQLWCSVKVCTQRLRNCLQDSELIVANQYTLKPLTPIQKRKQSSGGPSKKPVYSWIEVLFPLTSRISIPWPLACFQQL